jgi:hypothetical protein
MLCTYEDNCTVQFAISFQLYIFLYYQPLISKGGQAQLFFESAIAISQLEGNTSAIAIPQLFKAMLLRNRDSAIPQSHFFLMSATSNPQLESFISAIFGILLTVESGQGS